MAEEIEKQESVPIDIIVGDWLAQSLSKEGYPMIMDFNYQQPEVVWSAILKILEHKLTDAQFAVLAAGPVEDLLSDHGPGFIDRVESEAAKNPRFNHLLGGVWRLGMTDDVWDRVQRARHQVW
jgi:hypothetical protein